jgi:hypothetical protein
MSLFIKDETANATVLTIDNSGNIAFGDGTPVDLLSVAGYGIIDSDGQIVHGLTSCSVTAAYDRRNCDPAGTDANSSTRHELFRDTLLF